MDDDDDGDDDDYNGGDGNVRLMWDVIANRCRE